MVIENPSKPLPLRKTLFFKLVCVYVTISFVGASLHFGVFNIVYRMFSDRVEQSALWPLAQEFALDLAPATSPTFDRDKVDQVVFHLKRINMKVDIYLLDEKGTVIYTHFVGSRDSVPIEPILRFISTDGFPLRPIYGLEPSVTHEELYLPFSAARIELEGKPGFVYVVLSGDLYREFFQTMADAALSMFSVVFCIFVFLFNIGLAAAIFWVSTRRFTELTSTVRRFAGGDYSARAKEGADDEVGFHTQAFNTMAQRIEDNIDSLKENDRLRRELIANVSHDIRTPLAVIRSLVETLHGSAPSMTEEERHQLLDRTLINCQDLSSLVEDLFELAKLNARTEELTPAALELKKFLLSLVRKLIPAAEKKDLAVIVDVPDKLAVLADERLLNRAISNLLENAIRYSRPGGEIRLQAQAADNDSVSLSVSDTGIGISQEELPHVFDRFFRGSRAATEEIPGSGLGLAITKRIVELHQHEITVQSIENQGTTFSFTLTAAQLLSKD